MKDGHCNIIFRPDGEVISRIGEGGGGVIGLFNHTGTCFVSRYSIVSKVLSLHVFDNILVGFVCGP